MAEVKIRMFSKFKDLFNLDEMVLNFEGKEMSLTEILEVLDKKYKKNIREIVYNERNEIKNGILILKNDKDFSILNMSYS